MNLFWYIKHGEPVKLVLQNGPALSAHEVYHGSILGLVQVAIMSISWSCTLTLCVKFGMPQLQSKNRFIFLTIDFLFNLDLKSMKKYILGF